MENHDFRRSDKTTSGNSLRSAMVERGLQSYAQQPSLDSGRAQDIFDRLGKLATQQPLTISRVSQFKYERIV